MKAIRPILLTLAIIGCSSTQPVRILPEACGSSSTFDLQGFTITANDGITEYCLVIDSEEELIAWRWSADGNVFAYAVHNPTTTLPARDGRSGYYRPPATKWYITDGQGDNVRRFPVADNQGLEFSPDGKYAIIQESCYYTTCQHSVYEVNSNDKVCEYETETVWFGESNCFHLVLNNGERWDIRAEVNAAGCTYYEQNGWKNTTACK